MTDNQAIIPFHRSFLLGKLVHIDKLSELTQAELELLNVETLASLHESRHNYELIENRQTEEASTEFRRMKIAGYFQAAIQIELGKR
jgi:hypothetical protein